MPITTLSIVDDFLPKPWPTVVRDEILAAGFTTALVNEGSAEHPPTPYYTVNVDRDPAEMWLHVEAFLGMPIKGELQAFRLGAEGSHLHNNVHADHTCASLACVYFLNPQEQCQGGTAFWRHKRFGWDFMPTEEQLAETGYTLEELKADWHDPNAWEMLTLAGMKHNRLIIYPSQAFHSRWPWGGFGDQNFPETCRLIWCGFFNVK